LLQTLYAQLPSVLLIKFQGAAAAGQYALAERIANVVRRVMFSMSADAMPILAKCARREDSLVQFRRVGRILLAICSLGGAAVLISSLVMHRELVAHGGEGQILAVALFVPLCVFWLLNNIYGVLGLVVIANDEASYAKTIIAGSVLGVGCLVFAAQQGVVAVMAALLMVEIAVVAFLWRRFNELNAGVVG
jgi:O-antigen/teichoic acid export membrane protein